MNELFRIIETDKQDKKDKIGVSIAINVRIGDWNKSHPVSEVCYSTEQIGNEIKEIKDNLDQVLNQAKRVFEGTFQGNFKDIRPDMLPQEVWSILSYIKDENTFIERFNSLDRTNRKDLAEYILTKCNIFSGKGAVFSGRYNQKIELME